MCGEVHLSVHLHTREGEVGEHVRLLRVLLARELVQRQPPAHAWRDHWSPAALAILAQHAVHGRMSRVATALTRLLVYTDLHLLLPLDCRVFPPILGKLRGPVMAGRLPAAMVAKFHSAARRLATAFLAYVRELRRHVGTSETRALQQLTAILTSLHLLHTLQWRSRDDIVLQVEDALLAGLREWFAFVLEKVPREEGGGRERMRNLTRITHLLVADMEEGKRLYQTVFMDSLNINYLELVFREFHRNLVSITKDIIDEACDDMLPILYSEQGSPGLSSSLTLGTQLFGLYLALQQFYKLGGSAVAGQGKAREEGVDGTQFHTWFIRVVAKWLDIALYKAMVRIVRAVELDTLEPVTEGATHSSSAVDISTVLAQVTTFWSQLSWPDVETSYVFISRIMDDVCQAVIFYSQRMRAKAAEGGEEGALGCSVQQALAINNIDHVMAHIHTFVEQLGVHEVLDKLEEDKGGLVADACRKTIKTLMKNWVENVENQIGGLLEEVGERAGPIMVRVLTSPADAKVLPDVLPASEEAGGLAPLDSALLALRGVLAPANFRRLISVLWSTAVTCLGAVLQEHIRRRRHPDTFVALEAAFHLLRTFLYGDSPPGADPAAGGLEDSTRLLSLFSSSPRELIQRFYKQRMAEQTVVGGDSRGTATLRTLLQGDLLTVQVINCRHLRPPGRGRRSMRRKSTSSSDTSTMEVIRGRVAAVVEGVAEVREETHRHASRGMCSPYVTVKVLDGEARHLAKGRTSARCRTLFPEFGESLELVLPPHSSSSLLLVSVKDRGPLGDSLPLGEALLPLSSLSPAPPHALLACQPALQLPLTLPGAACLDILAAMEARSQPANR